MCWHIARQPSCGQTSALCSRTAQLPCQDANSMTSRGLALPAVATCVPAWAFPAHDEEITGKGCYVGKVCIKCLMQERPHRPRHRPPAGHHRRAAAHLPVAFLVALQALPHHHRRRPLPAQAAEQPAVHACELLYTVDRCPEAAHLPSITVLLGPVVGDKCIRDSMLNLHPGSLLRCNVGDAHRSMQ